MTAPSPVVVFFREILGRDGCLWFRAHGHSMRPAIRDGDRLLAAPAPATLRIGDVVAYTVAGRLRVHRLLARRPDPPVLVIGGDNDPQPPDAVPASAVLGRVVARERNGAITRLDTWKARGPAVLAVIRQRVNRMRKERE